MIANNSIMITKCYWRFDYSKLYW